MLKGLKGTVLGGARSLGVFHLIAQSRWRRERLLILCYHGLSLRDEHEWRDLLYIRPALFRSRLELLARRRYRALPLDEAVRRLGEGSLPPKSVAITFDDGFYDFYRHGLPLLREFGFPATVYQTTYYSDYPYPVFNLILSYLLWRGRGRRIDGAGYNLAGVFDLSNPADRERAESAFLKAAGERDYGTAQKNELAARLACDLGVNYSEILRERILQLMTPAEVAEVRAAGIGVELHTHRHRTPRDESLFVREIRDNRAWLAASAGASPANHFCYPSGVYHPEFFPWLRAEGVLSATTCEYGIADRRTDPLLLPRLLDSMLMPETTFEGWLSGLSALLPRRRA